MPWLIRAAFLAGFACLAKAETPLVRILSEELGRNFNILKEKADPPPYFMAYSVTEQEAGFASATLGALKASRAERARYLDVTVRVGSPKLDNYHRLPGETARFSSGVALPIEDNPAAIQRIVWLETDRVYRLAAERLIKVRTSREVKVAEEDDSDDFSPAEPAIHAGAPRRLDFPLDQAAARVRKYSGEFARHSGIITSQVTLTGIRETRYFVSTEGARLEHGRNYVTLTASARTKAADGMDLAVSETFDADGFDGLPGPDTIAKSIERLSADLSGLVRAPSVEPYAGPAILSGRAAAVLFHEIFGHRIEGHRQKDESEGQTFAKSIGAKVVPEFLSVIFDPTRAAAEGETLNGHYLYDDEGVKARPVTVVDRGILKTFLLSRSPVRGFSGSNGHGRRQPGAEIVARQSSMFIDASDKVSDKRLREMLIEEVRKRNKPYGLYFKEVTGGFTTTGRRGIQAFKVVPVIVYQVFPDGRPDVLARGADIVGTPLASFSRIVAASDRREVFNGYCGAESGSVPVSAVAPAILVSEIEIQRQQKSDERPPLLPPPPAGGAR